METIRILLVGERLLIRAGVRAMLKDYEDVFVVGEAGDAPRALHLVGVESPDVVLAELGGPAMAGLGLAGDVARQHPGSGVIMLDDQPAKMHAYGSFRAGARGYLPIASAAAEWEAAVRSVAGGQYFLSPSVTHDVLADLGVFEGRASKPSAALSPRQVEVLRLIAEGRSTKEIAASLGLSVKTVEAHRSLIMTKLGIHKVAGLVRYALRFDLGGGGAEPEET